METERRAASLKGGKLLNGVNSGNPEKLDLFLRDHTKNLKPTHRVKPRISESRIDRMLKLRWKSECSDIYPNRHPEKTEI
jgi:hypothetical protein